MADFATTTNTNIKMTLREFVNKCLGQNPVYFKHRDEFPYVCIVAQGDMPRPKFRFNIGINNSPTPAVSLTVLVLKDMMNHVVAYGGIIPKFNDILPKISEFVKADNFTQAHDLCLANGINADTVLFTIQFIDKKTEGPYKELITLNDNFKKSTIDGMPIRISSNFTQSNVTDIDGTRYDITYGDLFKNSKKTVDKIIEEESDINLNSLVPRNNTGGINTTAPLGGEEDEPMYGGKRRSSSKRTKHNKKRSVRKHKKSGKSKRKTKTRKTNKRKSKMSKH